MKCSAEVLESLVSAVPSDAEGPIRERKGTRRPAILLELLPFVLQPAAELVR